jgi:integrase
MPCLRLYTGEQTHTPPDARPLWTLRQFYRDYFCPNYLEPNNRHRRTAQLYQQVVDLWEESTHNPPLLAVSKADTIAWKAYTERSRAPETTRKLAVHLQKLLDFAGPETARNDGAAGLLAKVPRVPRPPHQTKAHVETWTLPELSAILAATSTARHTPNLYHTTPHAYWRALFTFAYNTGLRIGSIMSARWEWIDGHWLTIPPNAMKGGKHGGRFYLNHWAMDAAQTIRSRRPELFPWANWPVSEQWLHNCRREILAESLPPPRRFGFHAFRKTLLTWAAAKNPLLASLIAGHRTGNVLREFYVAPEAVAGLLDTVPQPTSGPTDQRTLF